MKKTLIALAVAGVVAAPAAMADVTVYGQAHASIGQDNNGDKGTIAVNSNSSRFGIKAAESLDGGLTAVAQYEFGVAMDKGTISGRNQFVGLAGGFGTILAGRHDAPLKMATGALDVFADTAGDYNGVIGVNGLTDVRADNVIAYVAPAISGATIVLAYVADEDPNATADAMSAAVMWGQGPLAVDFGYLSTGKDFPTVAEATDIRIGVGYTVSDALKVAFIMDSVEAAKNAPKSSKFTDWLVNGAFNMGGGNTLKAEFGVLDPDGSDNNSTLLAVGLDHAFSKNTTGYVVYASMANDKAAAKVLGGSTIGGLSAGYGGAMTPAAGKDPSAIEVGMVVKF